MGWVDGGIKIQDTLLERGNRYGSFKDQSTITQKIKRTMKTSIKWNNLSYSQEEALEMIAGKIARIINGDPNYIDSWHDIAGYATLIEQELKEKDANTAKEEVSQTSRINDLIESRRR